MYINDLGIKEINQYYAQHGGRRTALIKGFANYMESAKTNRQTASGTAAQTARQATSKAQSDTEGTDNSTAGASGSGDSGCDKCQLTQQLMLRMMTNNLYTQNGLGYSAMGSGALAAYQSLSKYFGTGLFS